MSKFSRVKFPQFVAWNIHTVVFLSISVLWLFCWQLCRLCGFWSLQLVFLCSFSCSLRVLLLMRQRYLQYWRILFLLFLTHIVYLCHLSDVRPYASLVFLYSGPLAWILTSSILRMVPSILQDRQPRFLSLWWDFCSKAWFRDIFLIVWYILFLCFSFISTCLMICTSNIPIFVILLFPKCFDSFLILQSCSFRYLSFSAFHYKHGIFFYATFHSYILAVYSYCLY